MDEVICAAFTLLVPFIGVLMYIVVRHSASSSRRSQAQEAAGGGSDPVGLRSGHFRSLSERMEGVLDLAFVEQACEVVC